MTDDAKKTLNEGLEKRGGLNKPPEKPKPNIKPQGQNPTDVKDSKK